MRRAAFKDDRGEIFFTKIGPNHVIPMKPWPQSFHVTRTLLNTDAVEVRPFTMTGIFKGVVRNFVAMNLWRLCWILRCLGFLKTDEACCCHWRDLTFSFWRYQQVRRFRWVTRMEKKIFYASSA